MKSYSVALWVITVYTCNMTTPQSQDYDANTGELLVHDAIDGLRYPLSDLKGKYTERPWEEWGVSRAQVIEAGGYRRKRADGKNQWMPVHRGKICPDFEDTTGAKPKHKGKGGTQVADAPPDAKVSFIDELAQNGKVIRSIRRHTDEMGRLEADLSKIPFLDPGDGEDHKWLNNLYIGKLHPQVRMIASLQKARFKVYADEDAGWKEKQAADKMVMDAVNKAYDRTDRGFDSIFKAMTKIDQIKDAVDNIDGKDATGKKRTKEELAKLQEEAQKMGIPAEFTVVKK